MHFILSIVWRTGYMATRLHVSSLQSFLKYELRHRVRSVTVRVDMRTHIDPIWGQIVRRAGLLEFPFTEKTNAKHESARVNIHPFRSCSFSMQAKAWVIKLYLGSEQKSLGSFEDSRHASRFADMAITHFWKYRKTFRKCDDSDLNYGLAQVSEDRENMAGAVQCLCEMEAHLIQLGVLKDFSAQVIEREKISNSLLFRAYFGSHKTFSRCCNFVFHEYETKPEAKVILDTAKEKLYELNQCMQSLLKL